MQLIQFSSTFFPRQILLKIHPPVNSGFFQIGQEGKDKLEIEKRL